ncbi:hypothetical protein ACFW9D_03265 [Streptomyces sp. NPDC059524]|uniref:hypothetical protein n=1 Tax=Streptomyces sp. NPDC059524 TaxID=3346856 RepID=UPI0036D05677
MRMRLIPDDPFPEIGHPFTTDVSADGRWIAVSCHANGRDGRGRVAVYRTSDLALWDQLVLGRAVETLTFHPVLSLLAVGTGEGDEFEAQGGLHLYEPETRRRVDVEVAGAEVVALSWRDARRLEVTFSAPIVDYEDLGNVAYTRAVAERDDWSRVTADVLAARTAWPQAPAQVDWTAAKGPGVDAPQRYLAAVAAEHGTSWSRRSGPAAVEALSDGRVLVARPTGTLLECWAQDGTLLWSLPEPEDTFERSGCRLHVTPDEESVWITVLVGTSDNRRTRLCRFALADGAPLAELALDFPVVIAARTDGAWVARDSRDLFPWAHWPPVPSVVLTPTGRQLGTLELGECHTSFDLPVRRSPHLLFLYGDGPAGVQPPLLEKWVVRAGPEGIERLFPLSWDDSLGVHHGGPAVYVDDALGAGLVHGCTGRDGSYLVRRSYPDGAVVWAHRFDTGITGVDAHDGLVHAVTAGPACELLTLRGTDGAVLRRQPLALGAHVYTPTCLSAGPDGELLIGTAEGRIVRARA